MLVQIAMQNDESSQVREGVAAVVRTALGEMLEIGSTEPIITIAPAMSASGDTAQREGRKIAILVIVPDKLGERSKRNLFGRIMDLSERDLEIQRERILIGIIETGRSNWSNGYTERKWLETMSYQLP
ncbi:hypothetical protein AC629_34280 [Bradyrhizobium sp. NAS80.1]|uniref:hypothetical protein n=1 Tax=Bradyrhizobium sp. NAS80.1 TaxID=1680159 RepID=UPI00095DDDBD|nr:hypothetical protein [Bradyrhizobium sp. NAS80.1]OKO75185.1 hypothetical protein AC629_34280 [Bradyrhizobium sp. NAS80.1]